jgi:hypothetical protein
MANRVMTVLEAHVPAERWADLERAFAGLDAGKPAALIDSYLAQGITDPTIWRLVGVWQSREALDAYRTTVPAPGGVLLFRAVGVEPSMTMFEVRG